MNKLVAEITASQLRDDLPDFRPGDSVKVHVKVVEGNVHLIKGDSDEALERGIPISEGDVLESHGRGVLPVFGRVVVVGHPPVLVPRPSNRRGRA